MAPGCYRGQGGGVPPRHVNPWLVLSLVCLAQFMVILDATIVNVALPSIQTDLNMSEGSLQWVVNSYTLTFGGFLLLGGRAGDLIGRKRVFLTGSWSSLSRRS
jgi:MFS family permease